jgi:hypothetical protein
MPPDRDLMDALTDELPQVPVVFSDRLQDLDVLHLAAFARSARLTGTSFGRHLLHDERTPGRPVGRGPAQAGGKGRCP